MLLMRQLVVEKRPWGFIYVFEKTGDEFPTHVHDEGTNHITVVMFGSLRCMGHPKYEGKIIKAQPGGTIIAWKAGEPHGFVALEDGTTIMNLQNRHE